MNTNKIIKTLLTALIFSTFSFGCASKIMVQTEPISSLEANKSLITFMLPSSITDFGSSGTVEFEIWDHDKFIGTLSKKTRIEYQAEPGQHVFYALGENWTILKADLNAGKKYYVIVNVYPGLVKYRVVFQPVKPGSKEMEVSLPKWLNKLTPMTTIPEKYPSYAQGRKRVIDRAISNYESGRAQYTTLDADYGIE